MRVKVGLVLCVGLLVSGLVYADGFDIEGSIEIPIADVLGDNLVINPCADPPQLIEDFDGMHAMRAKLKYVRDDDDNIIAMEGHMNFNHKGVTAVGYTIELDEEGEWVWDGDKPKKAVDEDGEFITTDYNVPGTYTWVQNLNENHKDGDHWSITEVFMCKLVSKGSQGNGMIHFNGHTTVTEGGEIDMYTENYWCKCQGMGQMPADNGPVDCEQFEEFCQEPILPSGPR